MSTTTMPWLILFLPLAGAVVNGFFGRKLPRLAIGIIGCTGPAISFVLSCLVCSEIAGGTDRISVRLFEWIAVEPLRVAFGLSVDPLASVMILVVTGVGALIHLYSIGYMKDEPGLARYFAYLNLFMFAMLTLVLGDNLVMMFLGWEGVGLCSYLLIGFWYEDHKNADAGRKAFVVNRVGDFGFLLGIFSLFALAGTVDFVELKGKLAGLEAAVLLAPALLLFLGACGKSAQIPLHVWLPDAMAGPTPVSALIHAATMVTAGVYMIGRMHFLFAACPQALQVIVLVAAATALFAAFVAAGQNDIKKILAWSTISQLGFMIAGMASAQFHTGMFHVVTHAFFKALLFLGAGAVIHALHGEQDIRKMGGLAKKLPLLAVCFIIGGLALSGLPLSAGYVSKDAILAAVYEETAFQQFAFAWAMLVAAALLTAFYTTRLFVVVFLAPHREEPPEPGAEPVEEEEKSHEIHKPGWQMMAPLVVLAVLSLAGGLVLEEPVGKFLHRVWGSHGFVSPEMSWLIKQREEAHIHAHALNRNISMVVFTIGFLSAFWLYGRGWEKFRKIAAGPLRPVYRILENGFYVDRLYQATIILPLRVIAASLWFIVDRLFIDTLAVDGTGAVVRRAGAGMRRIHTGSIAVGLGVIVAGAVLMIRLDDVTGAFARAWTWLVG